MRTIPSMCDHQIAFPGTTHTAVSRSVSAAPLIAIELLSEQFLFIEGNIT